MKHYVISIWAVLFFSNPILSLPTVYDLRSVHGKNYVSSVKSQNGGTCWTHGTIAAIESNLMLSGIWESEGESGEANLAEYHLDWWNGFNRHFNNDIYPKSGGLTVHEGGDYRVAAAYLARGAGPVRDNDAQSYSTPPKEFNDTYHYYYVRDIEWFSLSTGLSGIDRIKQALMEQGVLGTALAWTGSLYNSQDNTFYQPVSNLSEPNHAVAIVGWDDQKQTKASEPGAWLVKNSWGSSWGNSGYFWISYFDKVAGKHLEMGAVSFANVERLKFQSIYYHDYHGWRATQTDAVEAFNAFKAKGSKEENEIIRAVSFYSAADDVKYSIAIYDSFIGGELVDLLSAQDGVIQTTGFHTIDLNWPVPLKPGDDFYVYVKLDKGGHAFDRTSDVPLLLGASYRPIVESSSIAGQSYYRKNGHWVDFYESEKTGNFCVKALATFQ